MKFSRTFSIRMRKRRLLLFPVLALLLLLAAAAALCLGIVCVSPKELLEILLGRDTASVAARIVRFSRLPRLAAALLAGSALAVSGAIIQSVLANPLAAPNIIGVNAGAGLAVTLCCAFLPAALRLQSLAAFLGAFVAVLLIFSLSQRAGASRMTLVLAGVIVSAVCNAATDLIVTFVPDALTGYSDFRIGGLNGVSFQRLFPAACLILPALLLACTLPHELDVLNLGAETASGLGMRVGATRTLLLAIAAVLAGAAVSFAGLLGFVGLIVPHVVRMLVGGENRFVIPTSMLVGAILLTLCDLAGRTVFAPYELPVGILLAFLGGPFFLWLLLRRRGGHGND